MDKASEPKDIKNIQDKELEIGWEDGHTSRYSFRYLRQNCGCALCQHEWTGEKLVKANEIATDLTVKSVSPVGRYALIFSFSDGHATGIYPFERLRELCPCAACKKPAS